MRPIDTTPTAATTYKLPFGAISQTVRRDSLTEEPQQYTSLESAQLSSIHGIDENLGSKLGHIYGYGAKRKSSDPFEEFATKPEIKLSDLPHPSKLRRKKKKNAGAQVKTTVCSNSNATIISHLQQLKKKVAYRCDGGSQPTRYTSYLSKRQHLPDETDSTTIKQQNSTVSSLSPEKIDGDLEEVANHGYCISETVAHKSLPASIRKHGLIAAAAKPPPLYIERFSLHRTDVKCMTYPPESKAHRNLLADLSPPSDDDDDYLYHPAEMSTEPNSIAAAAVSTGFENSPAMSLTTWDTTSMKVQTCRQHTVCGSGLDSQTEYEE